jgi:hypothetical protein
MAGETRSYPPGDGPFTVGRPDAGEDAGEKVHAWLRGLREGDDEEVPFDDE